MCEKANMSLLDSYWLLMAVSRHIMQWLHRSPPSTAQTQSLLTELHFFSSSCLGSSGSQSWKRSQREQLAWMELFGLTDHDVFICRSAVINGNLAECYFSEAWLKSGQAPVKLGAGNRVLISQSVGVGEDKLWTLLGYSALCNGTDRSRVKSANGSLLVACIIYYYPSEQGRERNKETIWYLFGGQGDWTLPSKYFLFLTLTIT